MLRKALLILLLPVAQAACGQAGNSAFGKEPDDKLKQLYAEPYDRKKEIRLEGKKYRIYNNYVTLGAGPGYNSAWKSVFLVSGADFNFRIQKARFQAGTYLQGQNFNTRQQIQLHFGGGYRKESYKYFWAAYGGFSYSIGSYPRSFVSDFTGKDTTIYPTMREPGLYAAAQLFYKLKFDYGIGATVFGDVNGKQYVAGIRIELFFSGAYRGTVLHKDEE
jgi:hypothetical protein